MTAAAQPQISVKQPKVLDYAVANRAFRISTGLVSIAGTTETPLLYILNGGSAALAKILRALFANSTNGHSAIFNLYHNPTGISGGSAVTPAPIRPLNAPTSILTATKSPTVGGNGTFLGSVGAGNLSAIEEHLSVLDPSQGLLITVIVSNAADKVSVDLISGEE